MKRVLCVGHAVQDFVFGVQTLPLRAEKYRAQGFECVGGGPAATAAVAIARLGGQAALACRVGTDAIAEAIVCELQQYSVDCRYIRRFAGCKSSISSVMVDGSGERQIVNYMDPSLPVSAEWLDEIDLSQFDAVLGDVRWPAGSARLLGRARTAGLPAVLDADVPLRHNDPLAFCATHVAFSASGLREFSGEPDAQAGLRATQRATGAWCAVTMGSYGVLFTNGGEIERQSAFPVHAVDTLGAGDVWHGAFVLALAEGSSETEAVRAASAAAALKVQRHGGRAGAPNRIERDALLGAA